VDGGVDHRDKLSETAEALLREVVRLPEVLFVMGKGPQAVMEGWVSTEETQVSVQEDWVSVEGKAWHCHIHLTEIRDIRFVEEPDVHDRKRQAFSVRLLGMDQEPLLMIFFGQMYDNTGVLSADKVARYRTLQDHYGV
jgi:putative heme iron utilization protein